MRKMSLLIIILVFSTGCQTDTPAKGNRVGGVCEYKSYSGAAEIISIQPGPEGERIEVRFLFFPDGKIEESYARTEGKTFLLYDRHFQPPSSAFLEKHELTVGKKLRGSLMVIIKGTCSPLIFSFPALEREN